MFRTNKVVYRVIMNDVGTESLMVLRRPNLMVY